MGGEMVRIVVRRVLNDIRDPSASDVDVGWYHAPVVPRAGEGLVCSGRAWWVLEVTHVADSGDPDLAKHDGLGYREAVLRVVPVVPM